MRFRYKVLMTNMILLSIALGITGFLMIDKNFKLAQNTQIKNATVQNNLVQSSVEYSLLDTANTTVDQLSDSLPSIGQRIYNGMMNSDISVYIKYDNTICFASDDTELPEALFDNLSIGSKNYIITYEQNEYYLYITSVNKLNNRNLCVITRSQITDIYRLMDSQIQYFKLLLVIILCFCSIVMYIISTILTRPLEQLNLTTDSISKGDYSVRIAICQNDEVGCLAEKFNDMAAAVSSHVDKLQAMVKQREQFVADFTHEIKTPMTSIIGYADMIRSKELTRKRQIMAANYIFSEGKRLETMSGKLFDFIYLNQHEITLHDVHTARLLNEVAASMQPTLDAKQISLRIDAMPVVIYGDKDLLKTAFINILDNARKASSTGDTIDLTGRLCPDGTYIFQITDYGIGMSAEDAKRICDEFYMIDKSRSRKEGGAGLGMSLVSIIIARHHAHLDIDSLLGEGTAIRITFDQCREEDALES